jgi:hypothetical protein
MLNENELYVAWHAIGTGAQNEIMTNKKLTGATHRQQNGCNCMLKKHPAPSST